ncbi:hypothetical protein RclHR1_00160024 [Rhizophagus clarus]|uniref:BTB domain-containing protein n=1 Tax=Rhizophagus clarus TaxID=94130 RepID=A0A2Z6R9D0_9GLOM|nr:hypothetical protein RclHR1_00160024 [Rhizophagus clarus]GES81090.1 hypothetical protein GLOIN_2v1836540 [Rhizophagus clarus]
MEEPTLCLEILKNFENLFETKKDYDVIIQAGEGLNQKEIYAHSAILCCQSSFFDTEFKNGNYTFRIPNISPHIFEAVLRYLYCGHMDLNSKDGPDILKLLVAADELSLHTLSEYIQDFVNENQLYLFHDQKEIFKKDPVGILVIIYQYESLTTLKDHFLKVICQEPDIILGINHISRIPAHILESILVREDLALNEIDAWDKLITWAHEQQPTVNKDPSKWTSDEAALMQRTVSRFIPLIRFQDINTAEYYQKIYPYQGLLPERLSQDIWQFHYAADMKPLGTLQSRSFCTIDSILIKTNHLALFSSWIADADVILTKIPYKFNLILRGSRDGFNANTFHEKCDDKGATIIVAKIKGSNRIIGGYNPLDWNGNGDKTTSESFIYTFGNQNIITTGRIGRVLQPEYAVRCYSNYGPLFGSYNLGSNDIMMTEHGEWSSVTNSYPNLNIPRNFEIDDYEVFQVSLKFYN